jgi:hypothetical protein
MTLAACLVWRHGVYSILPIFRDTTDPLKVCKRRYQLRQRCHHCSPPDWRNQEPGSS